MPEYPLFRVFPDRLLYYCRGFDSNLFRFNGRINIYFQAIIIIYIVRAGGFLNIFSSLKPIYTPVCRISLSYTSDRTDIICEARL